MRAAAADLLAELRQRGIELVARGDRLRYRPRAAVTPDLAERLRAHKGALLTILAASSDPGGATPAVSSCRARVPSPPVQGPCYRCRRFVWWESVYGVVVCGACHPPAVPELVRRWLKSSQN